MAGIPWALGAQVPLAEPPSLAALLPVPPPPQLVSASSSGRLRQAVSEETSLGGLCGSCGRAGSMHVVNRTSGRNHL